MLHALIMAGGAGTRFWPLSRRDRPKQLLDLIGGGTMIQQTYRRLGELAPPERTLVMTNGRLVAPMREQLAELPAESVIGEPCKRDTAPCIGFAAALFAARDPEAVMVVMPADHVIEPVSAFQQAVLHAVSLVEADPTRLVTFGIAPTHPAEIFGYIERADEIQPGQSAAAKTFRVANFKEKPRADVARRYVDSGNYYWNAGIFVWKATTILSALEAREPEMHARLVTIADALGRDDFDALFEREFEAIAGKSIDYAVMEHAENVLVVEAPFQWDDLGSWQALARLRGADNRGNTVDARHLGIDTTGCIIRGEEDHVVVTVGVEDLIVVQTERATLVAPRDREESIREIVKQLEQRGWEDYL